MNYVVLQVCLQPKLLGGSKNLGELEEVINAQVARGYRLHTISNTKVEGSNQIMATMVFERL